MTSTTRRLRTGRGSTASRATLALVALSATACVALSPPTDIAHTCPEDDLVVLGALDVSGSARDEALLTTRLAAIRNDAERVADCDGYLTVLAYSASAADHSVLYDGHLAGHGATEIARDRSIPELVDATMNEIVGNLEDAVATLPASGSDLTAAFLLAADHRTRLPQDAHLEVAIYSDGMSNAGLGAVNDSMSVSAAQERADAAQVADVSGAIVRISGVGRTNRTLTMRPEQIASLRAYAERVCERSNASSCTILTAELDS